MSVYKTGPLVVLLSLLLLCGCTQSYAGGPALEDASLSAALDVQLGLLEPYLTGKERERAMMLLKEIWPLREERLNAGRYEKSSRESRLLEQLSRLYDRYTAKYLGGESSWGYESPPEHTLAEFRISDGTELTLISEELSLEDQAEYLALWDSMLQILPEDAFADFTRFTVFTDGPDETLAYVVMADWAGKKWEIAVDPADAEDKGWFIETVLHEYCHYLTLNARQAQYTEHQTADTYNEPGMVSLSGSYLDDFYQAFWTELLDDRLANPDSYGFFLRHEEDFVTDYASTDPSEDIAESFTYFTLYDRQEGDEIWVQKLNFFFDYPEMIELRAQIRARLGLEMESAP